MMAHSKRICSIDECDKPVFGRGWCQSHYCRWKRNGNPLAGRVKAGDPLAFLESVVRNPPKDCVEWPFVKTPGGYGRLVREGKQWIAHRLALTLYKGSAPSANMVAAHAPLICHNPSCINPLHLRWATNQENVLDRIEDGTAESSRGEQHPRAKLTAQQVLDIRADPRSHSEVARHYGVVPYCINSIRARKTWKHI